jgi:hypothetical protein
MDNVKTINEIAFTLLANACNVKEEKIIEAFDYEGEYKLWWKKRKGKKSMHIKEPAEKLMDIQKALLPFLYRLYHRTRHCENFRFFDKEYSDLVYKECLKHNLDNRLYGQIPNHSLFQTGVVHTRSHAKFMIKMDLKDAYYSVEKSKLEKVLYGIFFDEVKAYYEARKLIPESLPVQQKTLMKKFKKNAKEIQEKVLEETKHLLKIQKIPLYLSDEDEENNEPSGFYDFCTGDLGWWDVVCEILKEMGYEEILSEVKQSFFLDNEKEHCFVFKPSTLCFYPPVPFFPKTRFRELRIMIATLVKEKKELAGSEVDEIIKIFVSYIVRLVTFQNSLPKGAPTSGFLLAIMINESGLLKSMPSGWNGDQCSVWVDDFIITTHRKPTMERIEKLKSDIERAGFKHNPKKVKVYDLRNISGSFLGMKLVLRPLTEEEDKHYDYSSSKDLPRGYKRALKKDRKWMITKLALSKKKQKQYRAFLHRVTTKPYTEKEKNRAIGYYGHIMSVYQWPVFSIPASLSKVVDAFRKKFFSGKVKDNAKYRCKKGVKGVATKEGDMRSEVRISKSGK